MISRYDHTQISKIWADDNKFKLFLEIELAVLKAFETYDKIPKGISEKIKKDAKIDINRIKEIETTTKHDVIAFCTSITEVFPPDIAKYFHFGITSSDVIDSALTIQLKESVEQIITKLQELIKTTKNKANETKEILCMGRSHGMYAEPMSFGQKFLSFYNELNRRLEDYKNYLGSQLTVQFSGAVGNYTIITPEVEKYAASILNLKVEPLSTQIIPRDRIAKLISIGALTASVLERMAVEIRHLHHSDIKEVHEGFSKGQKGSSIMPHKKNPISTENITGISRVIRSHNSISLENCVLWHERDISHSSAERIFLPDHFGLIYYALNRMNSTLENLVIHREAIEEKVFNNSDYLSSYYLHQLIEKTNLYREDIYPLIQKAAFTSQNSKDSEVFYSNLIDILKQKKINIDITKPTTDNIRKIYTKNIDQLFNLK